MTNRRVGPEGEPEEEKETKVTVGDERSTLLFRLAYWQLRRKGTRHHRSRKRTVVFVGTTVAALGIAGAAFAYWATTGTGAGEAQSATVTNLTITAVAVPSPTNQLYPGAAGDAVLEISNPNVFPVTITGVSLPSATTYAAGYSSPNLTPSSAIAGCTASGGTASLVAWNYASNSNPHSLTTSLTVGANATLTVTMTDDATMGTSSPTACEGAYFAMPSLTGVTATSSTSSATSSPTTDSWTS